ncbi:hypothetical protein GYA19_02975 [Candidatus Beckwithbacteria bacterium]|nr:hypothetical protein [Candidatus Beckwithbacteria bacterium]
MKNYLANLLLFFASFLFAIILFVAYILLFSSDKTQVLLSPLSVKKTIDVSNFSLDKAPKDSLQGQISSLNNEVFWQSRIATQASAITVPQMIQQGELLKTGEKGEVKVEFTNVASVKLGSSSEVNFIQTLPVNLVLEQTQGQVEYQKVGQTPIAVRILHLLIEQDEGKIIIDKIQDEAVIIVKIASGSAKIAFNDLDYNSQVVTLKAGEKFIFDDNTRTFDIK